MPMSPRAAPQLHQVVGIQGALEALRELEEGPTTSLLAGDVLEVMGRCGVCDPASTLQDFVAASLLYRAGDRFGLTHLGIRTLMLLEAIDGRDLKEVFQGLSLLDGSLRAYELVREGMTRSFLQSINERPGFFRLYFCSPWIHLDAEQRELLHHAVEQAERPSGTRPEMLVIARPDAGPGTNVPATLRPFQEVGATIFLNQRLHTKLYIREPGPSGGYSMAMLGSQNLTRSSYLELGIRINADGYMVDRLIAYFWEIANSSHEV